MTRPSTGAGSANSPAWTLRIPSCSPGISFYEEPRPAEKVCIRPAIIEFPFCTGVFADGATASDNLKDSVKQLGHGAISDMRRCADGRYELRGDFGRVIIDAERPVLKLKGP